MAAIVKGPAPLVTNDDKWLGHADCPLFPSLGGIPTARRNRFAKAETAFHVVNRGNDRRVIFAQDADYERFLRLIRAGAARCEIDVHGYCPMPNHFHLLVTPHTDDALSEYMQWVTCCYACDLRSRTCTVGHGHVFQRRFWSAPMQDALHFLTVLRYVEANACRANLVARAENWKWGSLAERVGNGRKILSPLPTPLPAEWADLVNLPQQSEVLERIRKEIVPKRGRPPGS